MSTVSKPLRKLTPATVMEVGRSGKLPVPTALTALYLIYGVGEQSLVKPTAFDQQQKVIYGKFEAIRASDHAKFTSDTLYLPEPFHSRVAAALVPNASGETRAVEFALKVSYSPDKDSPTGYIFNVENIVDERNQDKMAAIRGSVEKLLPKALPAPAVADAPAPAPAATPDVKPGK